MINKHSIRDYDQIQQSGYLRIVSLHNPEGIIESTDTTYGHHFLMIDEFAKTHQLKLQIQTVNNHHEMLELIRKGKCDIAAYNFQITTNEENDIRLTNPLTSSRFVLIQHREEQNENNILTSVLNLAKETVYVTKGSYAAQRLTHLAQEIGDTIYVKEVDHKEAYQLMKDVADKKINLFVEEETLARCNAVENENIDYSLPIGFTQQCGWAVHKDSPALLDSLNAWISQINFNPLAPHIH